MFSGMPAYQVSVQWAPACCTMWTGCSTASCRARRASFPTSWACSSCCAACGWTLGSAWWGRWPSAATSSSSWRRATTARPMRSATCPWCSVASACCTGARSCWGAALFALFLRLEIGANHVQIAYYLGIVLVLFALAEGCAHAGEGPGRLRATLAAGPGCRVLAASCNLGLLWSTWEYGSTPPRGRAN